MEQGLVPGSIGSVVGSAYIQGRLEVDGNMYAHGGISISSSFVSYTTLSFSGGGSITTTSNGDLSLVPNGTGVVKVGSGTPTNLTPTSGELYVQGKSEFDGKLYPHGNIIFQNDKLSVFGTSEDCAIEYASAQTPDNWVFGVATESRGLIICEKADIGYDFAHAQQTNPTLFIQSANQSATEWISFAHDQTDGVIEAGAGTLDFKAGSVTTSTVTHDEYWEVKINGVTKKIMLGS
jgi:hypothetical protein